VNKAPLLTHCRHTDNKATTPLIDNDIKKVKRIIKEERKKKTRIPRIKSSNFSFSMTTINISPPLLCIVALLFLSGCEHNVRAFNNNHVPAASTILTTTRRHTSLTRLRLSGEVVYSETTSSSSSSSSSSKSSTNIRKIIPTKDMFVKPPRVVPDDTTLIPTLYNYDHCPFCVRVRLALGFKNIKHNLVFLANDDVATPTAMVGKKVSPIMVRTT
jgi:hypothetical protein